MNCNNCGYGLKQRCGDFEKIICTYEEGECVKITELKAQIEKMKCCQNCKHFDKLYNRCELTRLTLKSSLCTSLDKWELRR
jgi:hypothetical protein